MSEHVSKRQKRKQQDNNNYDDDPLRQAMRRYESPNTIIEIIELYPKSIQLLDCNKDYPLHIALRWLSENRYNCVIHKLIELFPMAVQHQNCNHEYPLHILCRYLRQISNNHVFIKLIELFPMALQQANKDDHDLPLHIAFKHRGMHDGNPNNDSMLMLIERFPMAVRQQNKKGQYPLLIALHQGQSECVLMKLIELIPEATNQLFDNDNSFGFFFARYPNISTKVIRKIMELHPESLQIPGKKGLYPIHEAIKRKMSTSVISSVMELDPFAIQRKTLLDGQSPLHLACYMGNVDIVEILLQHPDIDVNVCDNNNETPIHILLSNNIEYDYTFSRRERIFSNVQERLHIVELLLNHPFIIMNEKNYNNETPLDMMKIKIQKLEQIEQQIEEEEEDNANEDDDESDADSNAYSKTVLPVCEVIEELLEEFIVKQKWNAYCYHINDIMMNL